MYSRKPGWTCVLALAAVALAASALVAPAPCTGDPAPPPSANEGPLPIGQLIYQEAPITFQLDVNGAAAMQLLGPVLDAAADIARKQLPSLMQTQPQGPGRGVSMPGLLISSMPQLIDPAKDAIKSITHVTLLGMKPGNSPPLGEIHAYYEQLMTQRGWAPLATVRTDSDEGLLLLLAPGGKGLFGVLRPNQRELIVGTITTTKPIGDLVAQILRAGGPEVLRTITAVRVIREKPREAAARPAAVANPKLEALVEEVQRTTDRATAGEITWAKAEKTYLGALAEFPQDPMLREYVGRLYTRWGTIREGAAISLASGRMVFAQLRLLHGRPGPAR